MPESLAVLYQWSWTILLAAAVAGAILALARRAHRSEPVAAAGLVVGAIVVVVTALGMVHHALVSHAVFGRSTTNPWYFMTALPFLFVLVVRGLDAIGRRLAVVAAVALVALFVAIDVHGTWVLMPAAYADTADATLQWSRLSSIHPEVLSGDRRRLFLGAQLGMLGLAAGGIAYASRRRIS